MESNRNVYSRDNHTPGPWQMARFNSDRATVEIETVARGADVPDQGCLIALVGAYGETMDDAPDARLIAAAPDLLAACQSALSLLSDPNADGYFDVEAVVRDLSAAVLKARGE